MKNKKTLFTTLIFSFVFVMIGHSQLKVETNGKVKMGNARPGNDPNNEVTQEILGLGTDGARVGSKLSFGDYGTSSTNGANVYIGELGTGDSDKLELSGKNGFNFTIAGNRVTNGMAFAWYGSPTNAWVFDVWGQIRSYGITLTSDIRLKSNIKPLSNGLSLVQQLQGITYDFNKPIDPNRKKMLDDAKPSSEKEIKSVAEELKRLEDESLPVKNQMGFSAQDLQKILPQLVSQDEKGILSVNYAGIIPILVEAIKEQQVTIDAMKKDIELLKKK